MLCLKWVHVQPQKSKHNTLIPIPFLTLRHAKTTEGREWSRRGFRHGNKMWQAPSVRSEQLFRSLELAAKNRGCNYKSKKIRILRFGFSALQPSKAQYLKMEVAVAKPFCCGTFAPPANPIQLIALASGELTNTAEHLERGESISRSPSLRGICSDSPAGLAEAT